MADTSAEKLQNMNIQDFDGSEFDPFSPQSKVANMSSEDQNVDLLGGCLTNGGDKHVSFDQEAGIGLPDPSYISQGQEQIPQGQRSDQLQRNMSEGEILGYQNDYGESSMTGQMEYTGDSEEENLVDIQGNDNDDYQQGQGQNDTGEYSSPDPSQNLHEQYVENDYAGDSEARVKVVEELFDGPEDYDNDETDPDSWRPQMDPERLRRSMSPERSVSPCVQSGSYGDVDSDMVSSPLEMVHPEPVGVSSERESSIPKSEGVETPDLVSQGSQQMSSEETESLDSRSETEGTPRRRRIPKPKTKKPLELPPWNDNVVIPKPPRMKPTMIGKQPDLPPPSPTWFHRPYTAPARHNAKDASSDSGVEEESKSPRKSSGEMKKKYGIDTQNTGYRPGGGNIQVFSQKIDTKSITPRTDTTKPKSALSPRISPSKESPAIPKPPTPNTKHVHSKIGSLNNVKHSPGGGNVRVLDAKVDFSTVKSKVGSKDKIDHKPKGGDKKIESQKLTWQTDSKIGSLKNVTYSPGGGNVKDGMVEVQGTMNTRENVHYQPGGGNVPDSYEEDLDWDVDAKINTLDNLDYEPGGGCVKVVHQRLSWSAKSRVGSLHNATHTPGGGNVKILDQKIEVKAQSKIGSTANLKHKPGGGDKKIETQKLEFKESARSKVGSMDKVKHRPGGGDVKIVDEKPVWTAASKVESLVNAEHIPGGGNVKILDEKVDFSQTAKPKVGSMDKVKHQPGGGDKKIETQKLNFKDTAKARTDTGASSGERQSSHDPQRSGSVTSSQDGSV